VHDVCIIIIIFIRTKRTQNEQIIQKIDRTCNTNSKLKASEQLIRDYRSYVICNAESSK